MTAESKQTHNDFETEQNDFDDFEIEGGTKAKEQLRMGRSRRSGSEGEDNDGLMDVSEEEAEDVRGHHSHKSRYYISNRSAARLVLFKPSFVQRLSDLLLKLLLDCVVSTLRNHF